MIGRKRSRQACRIALAGAMPWSRCAASAKSIIMIAFFLTMPISISTPIVAISDNSTLNRNSVSNAPMAADGSPARIVSGWM
ncbi:hypothetical protein D3C81_1813110 [compost metagenome]